MQRVYQHHASTLFPALRVTRPCIPSGSYAVDADKLREARQGVPRGEYHS